MYNFKEERGENARWKIGAMILSDNDERSSGVSYASGRHSKILFTQACHILTTISSIRKLCYYRVAHSRLVYRNYSDNTDAYTRHRTQYRSIYDYLKLFKTNESLKAFCNFSILPNSCFFDHSTNKRDMTSTSFHLWASISGSYVLVVCWFLLFAENCQHAATAINFRAQHNPRWLRLKRMSRNARIGAYAQPKAFSLLSDSRQALFLRAHRPMSKPQHVMNTIVNLCMHMYIYGWKSW